MRKTWPIDRWIARAAGGMSQRLNSWGAMIALRDMKDMVYLVALRDVTRGRGRHPTHMRFTQQYK